MTIWEKVEADFTNALKAGESDTANVLRLLKSELKNAEIAKGGILEDEDSVKVVQKEVKKRKEAISAYEGAGRADQADKEKKELEVLNRYAPAQASEDQIRDKAREIIMELESPDFGITMARMMNELKGTADGSVVSRIVKEELDRVK